MIFSKTMAEYTIFLPLEMPPGGVLKEAVTQGGPG